MKLEARPSGGDTSAQDIWVTHDTDAGQIEPVQLTEHGLHPRWASSIVIAVNSHEKFVKIAEMALALTQNWPRPQDDQGYKFSNELTAKCLEALGE